MSRVIKFRAWCEERKEWIYGDFSEPNRLWADNHYGGDLEHLCQFTGLLDKNGKEIYEGDILIGSHGSKEVIWDKEELAFWFKGTNWYDGNQLAIGAEYMAVIGNIYENPESLKK